MPRHLVIRSVLALTLAMALALVPGWSPALGLGGIRSDSALNEPFLGRIELYDLVPEELSGVKVTLASEAEFIKAGSTRPHFLTRLSFVPEVSAEGRLQVRVTSSEPIREPYLDFLVEVNWPTGRLVKSYTVLLDPPPAVNRPSPKPKPSQPKASAPSAPSAPSATAALAVPITPTTPAAPIPPIAAAGPMAFANPTGLAGSAAPAPAAPWLAPTYPAGEGQPPHLGPELARVELEVLRIQELTVTGRAETTELTARISQLEERLADLKRLLEPTHADQAPLQAGGADPPPALAAIPALVAGSTPAVVAADEPLAAPVSDDKPAQPAGRAESGPGPLPPDREPSQSIQALPPAIQQPPPSPSEPSLFDDWPSWFRVAGVPLLILLLALLIVVRRRQQAQAMAVPVKHQTGKGRRGKSSPDLALAPTPHAPEVPKPPPPILPTSTAAAESVSAVLDAPLEEVHSMVPPATLIETGPPRHPEGEREPKLDLAMLDPLTFEPPTPVVLSGAQGENIEEPLESIKPLESIPPIESIEPMVALHLDLDLDLDLEGLTDPKRTTPASSDVAGRWEGFLASTPMTPMAPDRLWEGHEIGRQAIPAVVPPAALSAGAGGQESRPWTLAPAQDYSNDLGKDLGEALGMENASWDEVGIKLGLARAYLQMDDPEAARVILNEALAEGTGEQIAEAKAMLARLE